MVKDVKSAENIAWSPQLVTEAMTKAWISRSYDSDEQDLLRVVADQVFIHQKDLDLEDSVHFLSDFHSVLNKEQQLKALDLFFQTQVQRDTKYSTSFRQSPTPKEALDLVYENEKTQGIYLDWAKANIELLKKNALSPSNNIYLMSLEILSRALPRLEANEKSDVLDIFYNKINILGSREGLQAAYDNEETRQDYLSWLTKKLPDINEDMLYNEDSQYRHVVENLKKAFPDLGSTDREHAFNIFFNDVWARSNPNPIAEEALDEAYQNEETREDYLNWAQKLVKGVIHDSSEGADCYELLSEKSSSLVKISGLVFSRLDPKEKEVVLDHIFEFRTRYGARAESAQAALDMICQDEKEGYLDWGLKNRKLLEDTLKDRDDPLKSLSAIQILEKILPKLEPEEQKGIIGMFFWSAAYGATSPVHTSAQEALNKLYGNDATRPAYVSMVKQNFDTLLDIVANFSDKYSDAQRQTSLTMLQNVFPVVHSEQQEKILKTFSQFIRLKSFDTSKESVKSVKDFMTSIKGQEPYKDLYQKVNIAENGENPLREFFNKLSTNATILLIGLMTLVVKPGQTAPDKALVAGSGKAAKMVTIKADDGLYKGLNDNNIVPAVQKTVSSYTKRDNQNVT